MAEITLTGSNSDNVAGLISTNFLARVRAISYEHALNLLDGTPTAEQTAWANDVLGGEPFGLESIAMSTAVQGNPASIEDIDQATDALIRSVFDLVIARCITAWVSHNPAPI